jgi:hypothetical protein
MSHSSLGSSEGSDNEVADVVGFLMPLLLAGLFALLFAVLFFLLGRRLHSLRDRLAADDESARLISVGLSNVAKQLGGPYTTQMQASIYNPTGRDIDIKSAEIVKLDGSVRNEVSVDRVLARKGYTQHFDIEDSDLPNVFQHKPGRWFNAIFEVTFMWQGREVWSANSDGETELRSSSLSRRAVRWSLNRFPRD